MTPEQRAEIERRDRRIAELQADVWVAKWRRNLCLWGTCLDKPDPDPRDKTSLLCAKHQFELAYAEAMRSGTELAHTKTPKANKGR